MSSHQYFLGVGCYSCVGILNLLFARAGLYDVRVNDCKIIPESEYAIGCYLCAVTCEGEISSNVAKYQVTARQAIDHLSATTTYSPLYGYVLGCI